MQRKGDDSAQLGGNEEYEGFIKDLLDELGRMMGFQYQIVLSEDNRYGVPIGDGRWNGLVGMVQDNVRKKGVILHVKIAEKFRFEGTCSIHAHRTWTRVNEVFQSKLLVCQKRYDYLELFQVIHNFSVLLDVNSRTPGSAEIWLLLFYHFPTLVSPKHI